MEMVHVVSDVAHGGELGPHAACTPALPAARLPHSPCPCCAGQIVVESGTFTAINSSLGDLMSGLPTQPDYAQLKGQTPRYLQVTARGLSCPLTAAVNTACMTMAEGLDGSVAWDTMRLY